MMDNPKITVFGEADENTLEQMRNCVDAESDARGALCADAHLGYSAPIGSAVAYEDHVSPSGVGFDIGCGNKAVQTSLVYADIESDLAHIMDEIERRISFGIGRANAEPVDHPVFDHIDRDSPIPEVRALLPLATRQLGTVGSGNHYVDLFREECTDKVWVGVHFGSRGFGHKIASGFLAIASGLGFEDRYKEGGMMDKPALIEADTPMGESYLQAMRLAGEYAYAGRDVVVDKVLEILGNPAVEVEVHNHHNYMWRETHEGSEYWVVRKGSTPLFPGQLGFVGATMTEDAVILEGLDTDEAQAGLYSAPHGAGRAMSRTQAAGKWRKRWVNNVRDDEGFYETEAEALEFPGATSAKKARVRVGGRIDYPLVLEHALANGIEIRGGAADEGPMAYKRLPEVLAAHASTLAIKHTLKPIGVCMADARTVDPYKD